MPTPRAETIVVKPVESPAELAAARAIRVTVFVEEQGIPDHLDDDGLDEEALHVVALDGDLPVGTGRVVVPRDGAAVAARIAVIASHRKHGLGPRLIQALEALARAHGARTVTLEPHEYLEAFYRRLGYEVTTGAHDVGEHRLITMVKQLD